MKNDEQSGFILMIVIMITVAAFVIGFAVYRITQANETSVGMDEQNTLVIHS